MRLASVAVLLSFTFAVQSQAASVDAFAPQRNTDVGDMAKTFPQVIAPEHAPSTIAIGPKDEPGDRMGVTGEVTDGKAPVADATVYVYLADARGCYPADCGDHGPHTFSARLFGAMRTDAQGHYRYETIRPKGYGGGPAHVHYIVSTREPKGWQFEMSFADDPVVAGWKNGTIKTPDYVAKGVSVRPATKDAQGIWHVTQDIVLKQN